MKHHGIPTVNSLLSSFHCHSQFITSFLSCLTIFLVAKTTGLTPPSNHPFHPSTQPLEERLLLPVPLSTHVLLYLTLLAPRPVDPDTPLAPPLTSQRPNLPLSRHPGPSIKNLSLILFLHLARYLIIHQPRAPRSQQLLLRVPPLSCFSLM